MADTLFVTEFQQACSGKGCPFCSMARATTKRYLSNLLYEFATAPDIHSKLAESRGFCNTHAWLLQYVAHAEEKDGLGVAILYSSVIQRLRADLDVLFGSPSAFVASVPAKRRTDSIVKAVRPARACLACEKQAESEAYSIAVFLTDLHERGMDCDLAQNYQRSAGACLPHFDMLVAACTSPQTVRWLAERFRAGLTELADQLETYMRKHQVEHRSEPMGIERDSWVRAIERCAGKRDVPLRWESRGRHA